MRAVRVNYNTGFFGLIFILFGMFVFYTLVLAAGIFAGALIIIFRLSRLIWRKLWIWHQRRQVAYANRY